MKIKGEQHSAGKNPTEKGKFLKVIGRLVVPGAIGAAFLAGILVQKKNLVGDYVFDSQFHSGRTALPSVWYAQDTGAAIKNWLAAPFRDRPPAVYVHIKHKNFQKLKFKQAQAMEGPVMMTSPADFVPAQLEYKGQMMRADIRLKGDWTEHIHGNKWSYRVKLKDEATLHGTRVFSLHAPRHRNHLMEWLLHAALRREGLIALRYRFHELFVNGESFGIYAFEEHFGKRLIENNGRREGPIVKFDESDFWQQFSDLGK